MTEEATQPVKKTAKKKAVAKKASAKKMAAPVIEEPVIPVVTVVSGKANNKEALKDMIAVLKEKSAKSVVATTTKTQPVVMPLGDSTTSSTVSNTVSNTAHTVPKKKLLLRPNEHLMEAIRLLDTSPDNTPSEIVNKVKEDSSVVANLTLREADDGKTNWEVYLNDKSKTYSSKFATSKNDVHRANIGSDDISAWLNATQGFSLGVIPEGVRFVHKHKNRIRIVLELPPGSYLTFWGKSESSTKQKYLLGCPYKIAIADFTGKPLANGKTGWSLYGCRMFFALTTMTTWDLPLYHTNFNNTNCSGYGNTGIGWTCFYHAGENAVTLKGIVNVVHHRIGGGEAYNEYNMPETQGADFYKRYRPTYKHLHGPQAWEKKTEQEGIDWVWNPDQWIPIIPDTEDLQMSHDVNKKNPNQSQLTIGRAVFSKSPMYYTGRGGKTPDEFYQSLLNNPYTDYTPAKPVESLSTFDKLFI